LFIVFNLALVFVMKGVLTRERKGSKPRILRE